MALQSERWLRHAIHALWAHLLPARCCMCGFPGVRASLDLCEHCIAMLPIGGDTCSGYPSVFSRVLVPFTYAYPVDRFIRSLKFRGERLYARVLGMLLADAQRASGAPLPEALVPMPLHASRYRARGFNQAHEIARFAARELGVRLDSRCLLRERATSEQSSLSLSERSRNVRDAFRAFATCHKHVALVDDVLTTGNTAAEAGRALKAIGAEQIELWVIARVLKHSALHT